MVARYVSLPALRTPLNHSAALYFATLALLAPFIGSLIHFAHSLVGQLKFFSTCSR